MDGSRPTAGAVDKAEATILLLIIAAGFALRWAIEPFVADDALITFQYGRNLAVGNGLVYQAGERIPGTTSPFYASIYVLLYKLLADPIAFIQKLGIAFDLGTVILLYSLGRRWDFRRLALIPPLIYSLGFLPAQWATSGMETPLYTFLLTASLLLYDRRCWLRTGVCLALSILVRIDAGLLAGSLVAVHYLRHRSIPRGLIAPLCAILVPWFLFALFYFGTPVPSAGLAKSAFYQKSLSHSIGRCGVLFLGYGNRFWVEFLHNIHHHSQVLWRPLWNTLAHSWGHILLIILLLSGIPSLVKKGSRGLVLLIWFAIYFVFYLFSGMYIAPWYLAPPTIGVALLSAWGARRIAQRYGRVAPAILGSAMIVFFVQTLGPLGRQHRLENADLSTTLEEIAYWVRDHTREDARICVGDIGHVGYYGNRYIIDYVGLVTPDACGFNRRKAYVEFLRSRLPDFYIVGTNAHVYEIVTADQWFGGEYEAVAAFDYFDEILYHYVVFQRASSERATVIPSRGACGIGNSGY